jgi:hypothetical protein
MPRPSTRSLLRDAFLDNIREAGMVCEIAENRAEGMEINGGGLLK